MKNLFYVLGLLVAGTVIYKLFLDRDDLTVIQDPIKNPDLQTIPSNMFPIQAVETPRVDNADQPWYSGSRGFMGDTGSDVISSLSEGMQSMSYNTNAFWTELESKYTH